MQDRQFLNRLKVIAHQLDTVTTLPKVGDLYYPVKAEGIGTGWKWQVSFLTLEDIFRVADILEAAYDKLDRIEMRLAAYELVTQEPLESQAETEAANDDGQKDSEDSDDPTRSD